MLINRKMTLSRGLAVTLSLCAAIAGPPDVPQDLSKISLEDLMNVQVTSVSKKEQKLSRAGAAVSVLTQEDIRRSGATNIPDLLRLVPGVDVAQIDANTYAISIRGFNNRLADKVLVLIDGRTVYTPTTSNVYWDQQDVPLEDIERIEVIRGPGGTVWGANAMNGVINIITKTSQSTQGGLVSAGGGSQGTERGLVRYGGRIGAKGTYRAFGNYLNTGNLTASDGTRAADGWNMMHGGFRSDWDLSKRDNVTVQGDLLRTGEGQTINVTFSNALPLQGTFNEKVTVDAENILGRWNHIFANGSDTSLQVYLDRYKRHDEGVTETLDTADFDWQHHISVGSRNNVVWGLGYRVTSDEHVPGYGKTYVPLAQTKNLYSTFVQDEIAISKSLWLTLGSKFEHNAFSGFEYEPSAQLVWTPTSRQAAWFSVARAIRQPSREEETLRVDLATFPLANGGFGLVQLTGDRHHAAEQLRDFEAGYRAQVSRHFSVDLAAFSSYYTHLSTTELKTPFFTLTPAPPHLVTPLVFDSLASAHNYGVEAYANWNVTRHWRISPGYSAIHMRVNLDPASNDTNETEQAANTPQQQVQVRSFLNLTRSLDWDCALSRVGRLREGGDGAVPGYSRVDSRLGWRVGEYVELSLNGQNLLTPRRAEFHNAYEVRRTLIERSVFGKITWRF
jgi:iron complex outermembrane receptor protein